MPKREIPTCLFCGRAIEPPIPRLTEIGEVIYGKCICGALYVCEPTGHNQGDALLDAMLLASPEGVENVDFGVNFELREREYDLRTHQYIYMKTSRFHGRLFFVRPKARLSEVKRDGKAKINKKDFLSLLENSDYETIERAALENKNILSWLIGLSYDRESILSWKAIEAMGHVAKAYIEADEIEPLRNTIRKLLWSMTDESGGVGWRAAEMIGEIVYANPSLFEDIIPILWSQREEDSFLESVLRGIIRLSRKINLKDYLSFDDEELRRLLSHKNEEIRALTSVLLKRLNSSIQSPESIEESLVSVFNKGRVIRIKASKAEKFL